MIAKKKSRDEAGFAAILTIIVVFAILVLCIGYATKRSSALKAQGQLSSAQANKWRAQSYLAQVDRAIQVKIPQIFLSEVAAAKTCQSDLPAFDAPETTPEQSVPATLLINGAVICSRNESPKTSFFGQVKNWTKDHYEQIISAANIFNEPTMPVVIVTFNESVRRFSSNASEPIYQLRYLIQSTVELDNYSKQNDVVLSVDGVTCGTSATLRVSAESVERGTPVTFTIDYTLATDLQVLNSADQIVFRQTVSEEVTQQSVQFQLTPSATDTYRVLSNGSGGCSAVSATIRVSVTEAPVLCPTIDALTTSLPVINSGESVTVSWATTNAATVNFEGVPVGASGSQIFTLTNDRTFVLMASDSGNTCPQTRTVFVRVVQPTPTPTPTPEFPTPTPTPTPTPEPTPTIEPTPTGNCAVPLPGNYYAIGGGGGGGSAYLPNIGNSYTRIRYYGGYYLDQTLKFNIVFEASGSNTHTIVSSNGSYQIEFGKVRVRINSPISAGIDVFDQSNISLGHYNWDSITGTGYRVYSLRGDGSNSTDGVVVPYANFDFINDKIKMNNFVVNAATPPPSNTPLNTAVSGNASNFRCPQS